MDLEELRRKAEKEERNKKIVLEMYEKVLMPLDSTAAAPYFGPRYIQHNPMAEDGLEGLKKFLDEGRKQYPNCRHILKRILADGDFVMMHTHVILEPGTRGYAVMDIFRLEDGKLVEHWDTIQPIPETSLNSNTMF